MNNFVINTFVPCDRTTETIKLSDIKPNDVFVGSSISFLSKEGPVAQVFDSNYGDMTDETYYYVANPDDTVAGVAGWYLAWDYNDELGEGDTACQYPKNDRDVPLAEGFAVFNGDGDGLGLTFSGVVYDDSLPVELENSEQNNWLGNCSPASINLGDLAVNDLFVSSSVSFLSKEGPVAQVFDSNYGDMTDETYYYVANPEDTVAGVAGWYLAWDYNDELGEGDTACRFPMNNRKIDAGEGFVVYNADGEGVIITIPSAL